MTRIIGGVARGRPIRTPPGDGTRPTADRVREALFSSLESSLGSLHGIAFLDVYAGTGAVGLEAASRGAGRVTSVERSRPVAALIAANARTLDLAQVEVLTASASALPPTGGRAAYDVAFLDPPYDEPNAALAEVVSRMAASGWLVTDAIVVVERSRRSPAWAWPEGFSAVRERRYGDTILWYGRWESPRHAVESGTVSDEEG
jgi:16S rRNA (guanine966-N2)-methyltransferase